jgi:hypothetical protein
MSMFDFMHRSFIPEESTARTQLIRGSSNTTTGVGVFKKEKHLLLLQRIEPRNLESSAHISNRRSGFKLAAFHWRQSG